MFQRVYSVAHNAFVETIRQPIYAVILVATAVLMILNVSLAAFTLENDNKLLLDLGLSTLLLSGLFLAAFSAAGIVSREIENKTALSVISKPVGRPTFILGKFLGLLAALAVAYYLSLLVFVLAVRHGVMQNTSDPWDLPVLILGFGSLFLAIFLAGFCNYVYGRHFSTTAIGVLVPLLTVAVIVTGFFDEHFDPIPFGSNYVGGQIILAAYLVMLVVMITAAVALAASTRLGQLGTLLICTFVMGLGIVSDYALGQHREASQLAGLAYRAVPNVGVFWVIDGLHAGTAETTVTFGYLGLTTAYAALITVAILSLAVAAFQKREVG
jgi:ABC-type transport system involved in multi-copper enzyme maturation permease subunit